MKHNIPVAKAHTAHSMQHVLHNGRPYKKFDGLSTMKSSIIISTLHGDRHYISFKEFSGVYGKVYKYHSGENTLDVTRYTLEKRSNQYSGQYDSGCT